jgi:hypothetical protein
MLPEHIIRKVISEAVFKALYEIVVKNDDYYAPDWPGDLRIKIGNDLDGKQIWMIGGDDMIALNQVRYRNNFHLKPMFQMFVGSKATDVLSPDSRKKTFMKYIRKMEDEIGLKIDMKVALVAWKLINEPSAVLFVKQK